MGAVKRKWQAHLEAAQRSGMSLAGYAATVASVVYFVLSGSLIWVAVRQAFERIMNWLA